MDTADTLDEAAEKLSGNAYDLVLVNRELAADESSGLELIAWMKEQGLSTPVMLVSDRPEAQAKAAELGAVKGFGKSRINEGGTIKLIKNAMKLGNASVCPERRKAIPFDAQAYGWRRRVYTLV